MQLSVHEGFRLQKRSKLSVWTVTATARFYKPWLKAQDRWHSIDSQFHDGAGSVSLSILSIKDGKTSIMCDHNQIVFLLRNLQDWKLLMLHGVWFSRRDTERLTFYFAFKCCQYCCYVEPIQNYFIMTRITRPKIVDTLLTVISKMGQGACCFVFYLSTVATLPLCELHAKSHFYYRTNMTKQRWHSVDAHFRDEAGSISHLFRI